MRIFLVRHGESISNVDKGQYKTTPDFAIPLSVKGIEQATRAAEFLREYYTDHIDWGVPSLELLPPTNAPRMWVSPYVRACQTANAIEEEMWFDASINVPGMSGKNRFKLIRDRREHVLLAEQQFGMLDGIAGGNVKLIYPDVHMRYQLFKEHGGRFWSRPPNGESRFDVCQRVHQAFGTFHRDNDKHGIGNIIVVAHGTTIRSFVMMWLHKSVEWFEKEPIPANCSVRLIENGKDKGYIYKGG